MWDLVRWYFDKTETLEEWLNKGYEPFAVTTIDWHEIVWLKKWIPPKPRTRWEKLTGWFRNWLKKVVGGRV